MVNPIQAKEMIKFCVAKDKPVVMHGAPGGGKSDVIRQVAAELCSGKGSSV